MSEKSDTAFSWAEAIEEAKRDGAHPGFVQMLELGAQAAQPKWAAIEKTDDNGMRTDCAVIAVALSADVDYATAHEALRKAGRKDNAPTSSLEVKSALESLGYELYSSIANKRLMDDPMPLGVIIAGTEEQPGTFLVSTPNHVLVVKNGERLDVANRAPWEDVNGLFAVKRKGEKAQFDVVDRDAA